MPPQNKRTKKAFNAGGVNKQRLIDAQIALESNQAKIDAELTEKETTLRHSKEVEALNNQLRSELNDIRAKVHFNHLSPHIFSMFNKKKRLSVCEIKNSICTMS